MIPNHAAPGRGRSGLTPRNPRPGFGRPGRGGPAPTDRSLLLSSALCAAAGIGAAPAAPAGHGAGWDLAVFALGAAASAGLAALARWWRRDARGADRRLSDLLDAAVYPALVCDPGGRVVAVNPAACAACGLSREEFLGRAFADLDAGRDAEAVLAQLAEAERVAPLPVVARTRVRHANGSTLPVGLRFSALEWGGRPAVLVAARDLSDRERSAEALARSESRFRAIFNRLADPLFLMDRRGAFLEVNPQACRALGYTREQLLGMSVMDIDASLTWEMIDGMIAATDPSGETPDTLETRHRRADGTTYPVEVRGLPVQWDGGTRYLSITRDLTDRERAESAMRAAGERLRLALDGAGLGTWTWDARSDRLEYDDQAAAMLGYAPGEVPPTGSAFQGLVHADDLEPAVAELAAHLEGRTRAFSAEFRVRRGDGGWSWVHHAGQALERDADGRPLRLYGVQQDITRRRRAEEALREERERLRLFIEHAPAALAMFDHDMRYVAVSRRWCRDYGLETEAILGRSHYEVFPGLPDRWREVHRRSLAGEVVTADDDVFVRADGSEQWLRWEVRPWYAGGEVAGILIFAEDVTERRLAEQAMARSEARYRELFEANPHPMWVFDVEDLRFLAVNDAATVHYGYSREEFLAMTIADIRPTEDVPRLRETVERSSHADGLSETGVWRHVKKDGSVIEVEITVHSLRFAGRPAKAVLAHDVTAQRRAHRELEHLARQRQLAFDAARLGWWHYDPAGGGVWYDDRFAAIFGLQGNQMAIAEILPRLHADDRPEVLERIRAALDPASTQPYSVEYRITVGGDERWVEAHGLATFEGEGADRRAVNLVGTVQDVTGRKRLEAALSDNEARFRGLFEAVSDAILVADGETGRLLEGNRAALELYGYTHEELRRLSHLDLSAEPEATRESLAAENKVVPLRWHRKKDGTVFPVEIRRSYFQFRGRKAHVATVRDVTERTRLERLRAESAALLRDLNRRLLEVQERERRHLARELHDEIGQALSAVKLNLGRMRLDPEGAGDRFRDCEEVLGQTLRQVRGIAVDLRPSMLDDLGLPAALRSYLRRFGERTGIDARFEDHTDGRRFDPTVETACYRAAQEALTNVARHSHARTAVVSLAMPPGALELTVTDDGVGFDPAAAFARASRDQSLGLAGMRERAELAGGSLVIRSAAGDGAEVRLRFGVTEPATNPAP